MPLVFANIGKEMVIKRIGGNPEVKKHLKDLGFTVGGKVNIVNRLDRNLIVKVKETRIAISCEMAQKILV